MMERLLSSQLSYIDIVVALLNTGVDVNQVDIHGNNAFVTASEGGHVEIVKLLL